MPATAMDWIEALDASFARGMQPLLAYQQEQRRLRDQNRIRQQQLQDEARQRGYQLQDYATLRADRLADVQETERFQTERDLMAARRQEERDLRQQQFEKEMADAAAERTVALRAYEWDHADRENQKAILLELKSKAAKLGIPAAPTQDFESAFDYYNKAVNGAESQAVVNWFKGGAQLQQEFNNLTGSTEQERAALQMNILLGGNYAEATKALTPQERLALQRDPSAVIAIEDRLARDKSKKGRAAFEAFDQALNDADAQATTIYAKRSTQNKERLETIKGMIAEHRSAGTSILKNATLGPDTVTSMMSGILDTMKARQQPAAPAPAQRPPPQAILNPGPASGSYPAIPMTPAQMQQARPSAALTPQDLPYLQADPVRQLMAPPQARVSRPFSAFSNRPATPQLDQFLQDQAAAQALLAPTAFPPLRVPQNTGAAP